MLAPLTQPASPPTRTVSESARLQSRWLLSDDSSWRPRGLWTRTPDPISPTYSLPGLPPGALIVNPSMFRAGVLKCLPRTFEVRLQLVPSLVPGALPPLLLPLSPASPPRRSPPRLPHGQLCWTSWSSVSVLLFPSASGPFCELPWGCPPPSFPPGGL